MYQRYWNEPAVWTTWAGVPSWFRCDLKSPGGARHRGALHELPILPLRDLHLDLEPRLTDVIIERLKGLDYDLAVITGDFRNSCPCSDAEAMELTGRVIAALHGPRFGILGNHDFIKMVPELERPGLPMLLNESLVSGSEDNAFSSPELMISTSIIPTTSTPSKNGGGGSSVPAWPLPDLFHRLHGRLERQDRPANQKRNSPQGHNHSQLGDVGEGEHVE